MKCYNCGFENEAGVSFCHKCGVNLKNNDVNSFNDDVEVLNREFKVDKKRQAYPAPTENSIKAKLMYKKDYRTGQLRVAKTKCATLIVFCGFFIFSFFVTLLKYNNIVSIFTGILMGIVFAIPVAIVGVILGRVLDKIFH